MTTKKSNLEKLFSSKTKASFDAFIAAQVEYEKILKNFVIENITGQNDFEGVYKKSFYFLRDDIDPEFLISDADVLGNIINDYFN